MQALHDYLRIEFQAKRPDQVSTNPFNRIATRVQILRVPQQNNAIDCGVFLLKYAECFMKVTFEIVKIIKVDIQLKTTIWIIRIRWQVTVCRLKT